MVTPLENVNGRNARRVKPAWSTGISETAAMERVLTNRCRDYRPVGSPAKSCPACTFYRSRLSSNLPLLSLPPPLDGGVRYTLDWRGGGTILVSAPESCVN